MYNPELEALSRKKLKTLQNERLLMVLAKLNAQVPFYTRTWKEHEIKISDLRGVDELHKLPFTRKSDLRTEYPFGMFAIPHNKISRIHASSGTTGKPTVVGYSMGDLKIFDEVVARSLVCAGARPGMKLHNAYGYGLFTGGLGMHGGATALGMAVIPVSGGMTERQLTILKDFAPEVICCTPSYALTLGEACRKHGIDTSGLALKYAVLGAEPWTELVRQQVELMLDVQATNIYGLSEIMGPGVSQEPLEEKGAGSHIWEDHFYPEVVDPHNGDPLPYGNEGVLVLTTLTKEANPLIRYWTNDICSIQYDSDSQRTHIKMSAITGRADDMLIIRGVNLFPTQVEHVMEQFDEFSANYQLEVNKEGSLDQVTLKVEPYLTGESLAQTDYLANALAHKLKSNLGLTIKVSLEAPGSIPRSEGGKLARVVDQR